MKLTANQIIEVNREMDSKKGVPVRFKKKGLAIDILTGKPFPHGTREHQQVYHFFTPETSEKIGGWLGARVEFMDDGGQNAIGRAA